MATRAYIDHIETFTAMRYFIMTVLKQQEKVLQCFEYTKMNGNRKHFSIHFGGKQYVMTIFTSYIEVFSKSEETFNN